MIKWFLQCMNWCIGNYDNGETGRIKYWAFYHNYDDFQTVSFKIYICYFKLEGKRRAQCRAQWVLQNVIHFYGYINNSFVIETRWLFHGKFQYKLVGRFLWIAGAKQTPLGILKQVTNQISIATPQNVKVKGKPRNNEAYLCGPLKYIYVLFFLTISFHKRRLEALFIAQCAQIKGVKQVRLLSTIGRLCLVPRMYCMKSSSLNIGKWSTDGRCSSMPNVSV